MMLGNCPSHLFGHRRSLSETHVGNELSSPVGDSAKSVHTISSCASTTQWSPKGEGGQSCTFRRTLSQSNLIPPLARNEHSHRKWRCSQKNGLLLAGDELAKVAVHVEENDPLKWEGKTHRNSIFVRQIQSVGGRILRPTKKEDRKISIDMKSELLDGNPSVSGNGVVSENYSSLEVGPNGVVLICNERGCSSAYPSETEDVTDGKDSSRIGGNQGSSDGTDVYYQKMLESNPGNPLLLSNYAKFLHEVQHDVEKAEKYYKRALMANPADGEILSLYAKFIWDTHNDAAQAQVYFRKAVEAASEDCYVVASYAHFKWNSTDEEEENGPSLTSSDSGTTAA